MSWFKKKVQPKDSKEKPPFPINKPNSCTYCELKIGGKCSITMEDVYYSNSHGRGYRTWDRCDKYAPTHVCATCKHYTPLIIVIADNPVRNWAGACARKDTYPYYKCWEAKE